VSQERAAGYGRASTDRQEESCPQQHDWAVGKARTMKFDLVAWEEDDGIPGDRLDRPGLERIFAILERHQKAKRPITVLLTFDQDRLSRATSWATGAIMQRLTDLGVERLVTTSEDIDLLDDASRAIFGLKQDLTKRAYAKALSKNVSRGMAKLAARGYWTGGLAPYAYRIAGESKARYLVPGPADEVVAVKELFRIAAEGDLGVTALAFLANERGWPVPEGCRLKQPRPVPMWTANTVHRILKNSVYLGMIRYGEHRRGKYHQAVAGEPLECRGRNQEAAPALLAKGMHEALVDRSTFDQVRALLASRHLGGARPGQHRGARRPLTFALSGRLTCDCCGGLMQGHDHKPSKFFGYICGSNKNRGECSRNGVHERDLLDEVVGLLARELSTKATLRKMRKNLEAALSGQGVRLRLAVERGQAHVALLAKKVRKVTDRLLIISDDLVPVVENELRAMRAELEAAEKDLAEVEGQAAQAGAKERDIEELLARFADLPALIARANAEERARIVQLAVASIRLRFDVRVTKKGRKWSRWTGGTVTLRGLGDTTHELPVACGSACHRGR
jgi:DNA invertase Pin-like site-specific DNA recombinase